MIIDIDVNEVSFESNSWGTWGPSNRFLTYVWTLSQCLEDVCDTLEYHLEKIN